MNIANAHGWLILNDLPFTAEWSGTENLNGVSILPCGTDGDLLAQSHFGSGVLTFAVNALFRTEPGYDLMVTGPLNQPKDGIQPLTGIVETDWAPFTFTMNWKFTRKCRRVSFERGEAYCMIFPMRRGLIEEVSPEIRFMDEDRELSNAHATFAQSRLKFNVDLGMPGSQASVEEWQKDYFRGSSQMGLAPSSHRTKIKLKEFKPIS